MIILLFIILFIYFYRNRDTSEMLASNDKHEVPIKYYYVVRTYMTRSLQLFSSRQSYHQSPPPEISI